MRCEYYLTEWLEEETGRGHDFGENVAVKIAEPINAQFPEAMTQADVSYGVSYGWWCATKLLGDSYTSAVEVMNLWYAQQEQNYEYEDACTALGVESPMMPIRACSRGIF